MKWPQQAKVVQTTAKNATLIRKAFDEAFDADSITSAWDESQLDKSSMTPQSARDWALAHVQVNRKPLALALSRTYANGWALGSQIARARILGAVGIRKNVSVGAVDWSRWTPGMTAAAALVKPTDGLKRLLDSRRIQIADDIVRTKIDRIGTALYTGLDKGYGPSETAKLLKDIINDPQHALMIARTETNRAQSIANREEYENNNVQQVEWLVAEPCDVCEENEAASPIGIDETFPSGDSEPPAHPNCVCALAPVFDDADLPPADAEPLEGDLPDEVAAEVDTEITAGDLGQAYEEISDPIRMDELARYQNYDTGFMDLLGLGPKHQRFPSGQWDRTDLSAIGTSLNSYKATGYVDINDYLRKKTDGWGSWRIDDAKEKVKNIDKAMKAAPPLQQNLMTYRGAHGPEVDKFFGKLKVGTVYEDKAFTSTTMNKSFAENWKVDGWFIEIENPTGSTGIMLDGIERQSAGREAEWLLPRKTKFEVIAKDDAQRTIRVRVVNG